MKSKFKLSQLAAVDTKEVELIHPKHGETGIVVTLAGPTHPAWKAALEVFKESEHSANDNLVLLASTVLAWDEEAFEKPYSVENVQEVLKHKSNEWMVNFLSAAILDNTTFFL